MSLCQRLPKENSKKKGKTGKKSDGQGRIEDHGKSGENVTIRTIRSLSAEVVKTEVREKSEEGSSMRNDLFEGVEEIGDEDARQEAPNLLQERFRQDQW